MNKLAVYGGPPEVSRPLEIYNSIGEQEIEAVCDVMKSGKLSGFIGEWCDEFFGGGKVRDFEDAWATQFGSKNAVAVNSNTSGLIAALGAAGLSPGDEVIVPPYTMSATVVTPLIYGCIPIFVDIEPDTFCLDPDKVKRAISKKTKAIIVVSLFGHPGRLHELRKIADEHNLCLIEDAAQAPMATENGSYVGTVGHIGVYSLNCHKHIQTGEGGICITDDEDLALRMCAIRNHGENVVTPNKMKDITNMVGMNLRMTELNAAIGIEQLKKLPRLVEDRIRIAKILSEATSNFPGFLPPNVRQGCRHVYYLWAGLYDAEETGVPRQLVANALRAEGVPISEGYVKPLYLLPVFQNRIAIGRNGWPFSLSDHVYNKGDCPVVEEIYEKKLLEFPICSYRLSRKNVDSIVRAFSKVFENLRFLKVTQAK